MDCALVMRRVRELDPSAAQMAALSSLVAALETFAPPAEITKNDYDSAISLHWMGYEVATYDDHFETYRFRDGETVIKHWMHVPGKPIAGDLLSDVEGAFI